MQRLHEESCTLLQHTEDYNVTLDGGGGSVGFNGAIAARSLGVRGDPAGRARPTGTELQPGGSFVAVCVWCFRLEKICSPERLYWFVEFSQHKF